MCIVKFLIAAFIAAILFAFIVVVLWFVFALVLSFYKIYLKPKPENKMDCTHDHIVCDNAESVYPFACIKCGKRF
jgi:hypothetical protein